MKNVIPLLVVVVLAAILALSCDKVKDEILQVTVSGHVRNAGQAVDGAIVLILNNASLDSGMSIDINSENINGSLTFSEGEYTIIRVEEGTYYVVAIKDENGNKSYDLGTDPIGWYGHDSFGIIIPDPIDVSDQNITGIDIDTLYMQQ